MFNKASADKREEKFVSKWKSSMFSEMRRIQCLIE